MVHKIRLTARKGLQLLCFSVFSLSFYNGYAQTISDDIKREVIQNVSVGQYEKATTILENNLNIICNDTTGLFDALVNLYFYEKKWDSVIKIYSLHSFSENEDTSILDLARFYSKYNDEKIVLNSTLNIPYKPNRVGTPIIEVKVNGKKYRFWVDTGCGMTVLSLKTAKECNIKQNSSISTIAKAATGYSVNTTPGLIDSLSIDNLKVYNHHCIIFASKNLEFKILGIRLLKIDGIIGWNLLQEFDVTINDKTKTLSLATSINNEKEENFFWWSKPLIACTDSVGQSLLFFIDTGASKAGLYEPFLDKIDTSNAIKRNTRMVSVGGLRKIRSYMFPNIKLNTGGQTLILENVSTLPSNTNGLFEIDGVLGMKELKNCIMHFNIKQGFFTISSSKI
ncbi:retroviral-like aspartic protease family protein [Bacteroidota bacterium]